MSEIFKYSQCFWIKVYPLIKRFLDIFSFQKRPYAFTYGVKDDLSGTDFYRVEESSGPVTRGSYKVQLPDGRLQIVTYVADEEGFKASVTYEGEPIYPKPSEYQTEYKPAKQVHVSGIFDKIVNKAIESHSLPKSVTALPYGTTTPAPYHEYHSTPKPQYEEPQYSQPQYQKPPPTPEPYEPPYSNYPSPFSPKALPNLYPTTTPRSTTPLYTPTTPQPQPYPYSFSPTQKPSYSTTTIRSLQPTRSYPGPYRGHVKTNIRPTTFRPDYAKALKKRDALLERKLELKIDDLESERRRRWRRRWAEKIKRNWNNLICNTKVNNNVCVSKLTCAISDIKFEIIIMHSNQILIYDSIA